MRRLKGRFVLVLVTTLVAFRLADMAVQESYESPGPLTVSRNVVIPVGGTSKTAAELERDGAIRSPLIFRAAAWFTRQQGPIRAGEYVLPARSSVAEVLATLRFAPPVEHQVTIPEGLTGVQIASILNAAPDARGRVTPPPDGAVLPQTYDYTYATPRSAILARAESGMDTSLEKAWAARDRTTSLTSPFQAVVLASIVQQESPIPGELPEIAAVYENRLALGMKLQADPTVIYAMTKGARSDGIAISRSDLALASPYNTYVNPGLPPGPICAPGLGALEAVLHPAVSRALFFVATGTGGHVFAENFPEQLRNIKKYRAAVSD